MTPVSAISPPSPKSVDTFLSGDCQLYFSTGSLGPRADHRPTELSGGQQQRVAIARALVTRPAMILADEPTGNLDSRTGLEVMMILQQLNVRGITIILVTHDPSNASYCPRQVILRDGRVVEDKRNPSPVLARDQVAQKGHARKKEERS